MYRGERVKLKCQNPEVVKIFATESSMDRINVGDLEDGYSEHSMSSDWGIPMKWITQFSKEFPNDVIICEFTNELSYWIEIFIYAFLNGTGNLINIAPNYSYSLPNHHHIIPELQNEKDFQGIIDKAVSFFRKLDITERNKDGELKLKWFKDEIIYKFDYCGSDGKIFKVESTKQKELIKFNIFECNNGNDWREIGQNPIHDDGLLF